MKRTLRWAKQNAIALLALFFALGGTSFAAAQALLPANSVGSRQVINNSLQLRDFKASQRAQLRGPQGLQGAAGVARPAGRGQGSRARQGLQGAQGRPGPQGLQGPAGTAVAFARVDGTDASGLPARPHR